MSQLATPRQFVANSRPLLTFRLVAEDYIKNGGSARYLARVISYFGDGHIADVHSFDVREMVCTLFRP